MMLRYPIVAAAAALMTLAGVTGAQTPGVPLTLDEAVQRARAANETVLLARTQRRLADAQIVQARAGAFPQVSTTVLYNRTLASIFDGISFSPPGDDGSGDDGSDFFGALPFGRPNTWTAALSIAQPLYVGGRVGTALAIARDVQAAADLEIDEAESEITLQVREAYFNTALADQMVAIAREAFQLAEAQLRQVELFRAQGTAAEYDVLRARVERDNLQPGIIQAENARRLAELNLKRLTDLPADQPVQTVTRVEPVISEVDRASLEAALARRPALRAFDRMIAARRGAIRIAQADRLPTVGLSANFAYQAFPSGVSPVDSPWRRDWAVSVLGSFPVFDGFRTRGQIDQTRAELRLAELQRSQVQRGLDLELEAALAEFEASRAQIVARRGTVVEAVRTLELAELRFSGGLATQLELSSARLLLQQARVNEAQALHGYVSALARLERVTGGEVPLVAPRLPGTN